MIVSCVEPDCGARFRSRQGAAGRRCPRCGGALRGARSDPAADATLAETRSRAPLAPGGSTRLRGGFERYEALEPVASDAVSERLTADDHDTRRAVEIRRLRPALAADPQAVEALLTEARRTAELEHPHILPIHEVGLDPDGALYVVTPRIDGERLSDRLVRLSRRPGAAQQARGRVLEIVLKVCEGVAYAHDQGVSHGDLRPAAIWVGAFGEVRVTDWAERDPGQATPASDIARLGDLLDDVLTAVDGQAGGGPRELRAVVETARGGGYPTVGALQHDVEAYLAGRAVGAAAYHLGQRLGLWARRHKVGVAAAATLVVVALGVLGLGRWRARATRRAARERAVRQASALADPASLPGWAAPAEGPRARGVETPAQQRARQQLFGAHLAACSALDLALSLAPDDGRLRRRRRELGERLGRIALLGGDLTLAQQVFADLTAFGATEADVSACRAEIERVRTAAVRRRLSRLQAILADLTAGLGRPGRDPAGPDLEDHVIEALGLGLEGPGAAALAAALSRLTGRAAGGGAVWSAADRDVAGFCCQVLGRLGRPDAVPALSAWLAATGDPALVVEAGRALCRTRRPEARGPLLAARERLGPDSPTWQQIAPLLGRLPEAR